MWGIWVRGALLGFSVAAPVGPIGLICFHRTLRDGMAVGLASGLGAAVADSMFGLVAASGVAAALASAVSWHGPLRLAGALMLCALGASLARHRPARQGARTAPDRAGCTRAFLSVLAFTLTSPVTIVSFAGAYLALGTSIGTSWPSALAFAGGIFAGSCAWWIVLTGVTRLLERRLLAHLETIGCASGVLLMMLGLAALVEALC